MKFNSSNGTSTVGHNKFSDMTEDEFKNFLGYKPRHDHLMTSAFRNAAELPTNDLPTEVNWVTAGGVNPVQD